jgi:MscS family membrane protein
MRLSNRPAAHRVRFVLGFLAAASGAGAVADGPAERHPLEPADLSSPRAAVRSFIDRSDAVFAAIRDQPKSVAQATRTRRMIEGVVGCLDLRAVAPSLAESKGRQAAVCLKEVFDRIEMPADVEIPDAAVVEKEDLVRWRMPHTEIALVRIADGPRQGEWLFSADTVERAEEFHRRVHDLPYRADAGSPGFYDLYVRACGWMIPDAWVRGLPAWAKAQLFGETAWRWLAVAVLAAAGAACVFALFRLARLAAAASPHALATHALGCAAPAGMIAAAVVVDYLFTYQIRLTGGPLFTTKASLRVVAIVGGILLVLALLRHLADLVIHSRGLRPGTIDTQLVRLGFKIVTVLAVAWMVIVGAGYLGISVAPLLAGLGVSGLAVALAAQHTVENVIAGLVLFADKPVRIGDVCRFGDVRGTVEQIGLRSTRIRCPDRTLVTIPNSEFAKLQLANFSRRDRILLQTVLTLRYETTADQLRYVLAALRQLLAGHPRIVADSVRVRFTGYGEWSLNVELFALADTTAHDEFLAIQEDVYLQVMGVVQDAGCDFAFPSQTQYQPADSSADADRCRRAEELVRSWRQQGALRAAGFLDGRGPGEQPGPWSLQMPTRAAAA